MIHDHGRVTQNLRLSKDEVACNLPIVRRQLRFSLKNVKRSISAPSFVEILATNGEKAGEGKRSFCRGTSAPFFIFFFFSFQRDSLFPRKLTASFLR